MEPIAPEFWCRFLIFVDAGHTGRNPNNVLVRLPPRIHDRRTVGGVVELGGHVSAPDLDVDGSFVMGVDVNWSLENVWGTRDLLAVSGAGYLGQYRGELTLPRTGRFHQIERRDERHPNSYHLVSVERLESVHRSIEGGDESAIAVALTEYGNDLGISTTGSVR